jgi:hypothetical protein
MPGVHKKTIVRYFDAKGRRVSSKTPGVRKIKTKSEKWYGRLPRAGKAVPLCKNKKDAETMLAALVKARGSDSLRPGDCSRP